MLSAVVDASFFTSLAPAATIHVEYFDKNKFYSEGGGGATQPPNDAWINQQRGFDVGFNDISGYGCDLKGAIFNDATFGVSTRTVSQCKHLLYLQTRLQKERTCEMLSRKLMP